MSCIPTYLRINLIYMIILLSREGLRVTMPCLTSSSTCFLPTWKSSQYLTILEEFLNGPNNVGPIENYNCCCCSLVESSFTKRDFGQDQQLESKPNQKKLLDWFLSGERRHLSQWTKLKLSRSFMSKLPKHLSPFFFFMS